MKKVLTIEGMHCKHCAESVSNALKEIEGIKGVKINVKKKTAIVDMGKDIIDGQVLKDAVKNAGFEVTLIEDKKTLF